MDLIVNDNSESVVYAVLNNANGNREKIIEFESRPFGKRGYFSLNEIMKYDLIFVRGYGLVHDQYDFYTKFLDAEQKILQSK